MKRRDLIRKIEEAGAVFIRHGGKHHWYRNPQTMMSQPVPRHTEIMRCGPSHYMKVGGTLTGGLCDEGRCGMAEVLVYRSG